MKRHRFVGDEEPVQPLTTDGFLFFFFFLWGFLFIFLFILLLFSRTTRNCRRVPERTWRIDKPLSKSNFLDVLRSWDFEGGVFFLYSFS